MKKLLLAVIVTLLLSALAYAANVVCPLHFNAPCTPTGRLETVNGKLLHEYHCTCGDNYWVVDPNP